MANEKKIQTWLPLVLSVVMVLGMAGGYQLYKHMEWRDRPVAGGGGSVQQVLDLVKLKYVDSITMDSLEVAGIQSIMRRLDPHSVFIPPGNISDVEADLAGNFSGIGVEYMMIRDTVVIVNVLEKGPAAQAGLSVGDAILAVNSTDIAGKKIEGTELRGLLRGKRATKVKVTLLRNGEKVDKEITRGEVALPSLDAYYMIAPEIGYIRLNRFAETTFFEFMDAVTALNEKGMKQMILDLRGNGGGLLDEATKIADELIEDGLTIVTTRGERTKSQNVIATKPGLFEKGDVVILLDELSASASEVLAGALQDHDRATIIGRRSFGKGLVQEQYRLSNGGALRLTIARYFTPLGRGIQKPFSNGYEQYVHEVTNRVRNGTIDQQTDTTGKKIFTTRKGKKLYESGGIWPDVVIPMDSTLFPAALRQLYNSNHFNQMVFVLYQQHRDSILSYPSIETFDTQFRINDPIWQELNLLANQDSIDISVVNGADRIWVEDRVKAIMARYRWRNQGFFKILNQGDPTIKKAVEYLQASKSYRI